MDWLEILGKIFEIAVFPAISAAAVWFITWINAKKQELLKKTLIGNLKEFSKGLKWVKEKITETSKLYLI